MITVLFMQYFCLRTYGYSTLQIVTKHREKDLEMEGQIFRNLNPRSPIIKTIQVWSILTSP